MAIKYFVMVLLFFSCSLLSADLKLNESQQQVQNAAFHFADHRIFKEDVFPISRDAFFHASRDQEFPALEPNLVWKISNLVTVSCHNMKIKLYKKSRRSSKNFKSFITWYAEISSRDKIQEYYIWIINASPNVNYKEILTYNMRSHSLGNIRLPSVGEMLSHPPDRSKSCGSIFPPSSFNCQQVTSVPIGGSSYNEGVPMAFTRPNYNFPPIGTASTQPMRGWSFENETGTSELRCKKIRGFFKPSLHSANVGRVQRKKSEINTERVSQPPHIQPEINTEITLDDLGFLGEFMSEEGRERVFK